MKLTLQDYLVLMIVFFGIIAVFIFASIDEVDNVIENKKVFNIGCGSDSMGVLLNCGDKVLAVPLTGVPLEGNIYIYRKNSTNTIIHRLVYCLDDNCTESIFKGDNNLRGEKVHRDNITHLVKEIHYR